ncbi:MAG: DNA-processing protein DprA [Anaerohalosphaeraceae bacterium]|nr:DNA-processing protein DprA [Anaerohalosphaeraceae bacterium]
MQDHSPDIRSWLQLVRAEGVGSVRFGNLIDEFGSAQAVLSASVSQMTKIDGIGAKTAEKIATTRDNFDTDKELSLADKLGVTVLNIDDDRYPAVLKQIYDPPAVLYVKGTIEKSDNLACAIVGSRRCSHYGSEQASRLAHLLAGSGFTIVSGMARGIDTASHLGALAANGRTLAVQGCGLANIFPPENKKLFERICASGACVSELPLEYEPLAENFPPRNRIIAGLSLGTIVIEAFLRSGALITAKASLDYNREVMAVPGKIDSPLSKGPHSLIRDGAKLIESVEDVIDALGYVGDGLKDHVADSAAKTQQKVEAGLFDTEDFKFSGSEQAVIDSLNSEPSHIEEIIDRTLLNAGSANSALISLRLKGLIKQLPGDFFVRRNAAEKE